MIRKCADSIGVIGNGIVGKAIAFTYENYCDDLFVWDMDPTRNLCNFKDVLGCQFIFVCVPTPGLSSGNLDTVCVDNVLEKLRKSSSTVIIKSTLPVGYTKAAYKKYKIPNLYHSPEFLDSRTANFDAGHPRFTLVGAVNDTQSLNIIDNFITTRFPHPMFTYYMLSDESEFVKLMINSFFATKVAFFNEMRDLSDKLGLNYNHMSKVMRTDDRVGDEHTRVPGPDGKFGFGGSCLPKDLAAIVALNYSSGKYPAVAEAAMVRNKLDREKEV